tara:strand:+ start:6730 stop:8151 length:1422 start_codon:yes stop_codon:yes gene_type:complete
MVSTPRNQALIDALNKNVQALQGMNRSFNVYQSKLTNFFNPIDMLADVFRQTESNQVKALQLGTTANKFQQANTLALDKLQSSNVSLQKFMITSFGMGLRRLSDETINLADELIITGQDTNGLSRAMGALRLLTGNSIESTASLSKTILDTSKETGVSTGELINALNQFQGALFEASLYGETAVQGLAELGTTLQGGLAGAPGATQAINTLIGMQDALNLVQQEQLGLRGFFDDIRTNGFDQDRHLQMIVNANERLQSMMGDDAITRTAIANQFGSAQVRALGIVAQGILSMEGLSEDQKKTQAKNLESMQAFEERKRKFFNVIAPKQYELLVATLPALAAGAAAGQLSRGIFGGGLGGGLGRLLGNILPVAGAGFAVYTFFPEIVSLLKGINNNTDATAEEARKKLQERRQANITIGKDFDSTLNIIEALISRSGAMGDVSVVAPLLQSMKDQLEIANSRPPALSNTRVTGP